MGVGRDGGVSSTGILYLCDIWNSIVHVHTGERGVSCDGRADLKKKKDQVISVHSCNVKFSPGADNTNNSICTKQ